MTHDFISLALIALIAVLAPLIANIIPKKPIPETVLLLVGGALFGPSLFNNIWLDESVLFLSDLGCAMLFLLAGFEINPKTITGKEGKRGLATWVITLILACCITVILNATIVDSSAIEVLAVTIALTTTAIGALMPILKERGLMNTRLGESVLAYGTWGELGPVVAMAILLSTRAAWLTVLILVAFIAVAVLVAVLGQRASKAEHKIFAIFSAGRDTTSQTFVRVTMLLLIALVAAASLFNLDIVLGAFAAGFILRYIVPENDHLLESKLTAIGYGFLIPLFFVVSGAKINVLSVASQPIILVVFIALLVIVRAIPIFLAMRTDKARDVKALGARNHASVAAYCTTALPLIVAVTAVAVDAGVMSEDIASIYVTAGALTVFVMPLIASLLYKAEANSEGSIKVH